MFICFILLNIVYYLNFIDNEYNLRLGFSYVQCEIKLIKSNGVFFFQQRVAIILELTVV